MYPMQEIQLSLSSLFKKPVHNAFGRFSCVFFVLFFFFEKMYLFILFFFFCEKSILHFVCIISY